ncbi:hypothetical protein [Methylobacterium sp. Gmos1]
MIRVEKSDPGRRMARKRLDEASKTKRVQLVAPESFLDRVEEWRAVQRPVLNVSAAIRKLCEMALDDEERRDGKR